MRLSISVGHTKIVIAGYNIGSPDQRYYRQGRGSFIFIKDHQPVSPLIPYKLCRILRLTVLVKHKQHEDIDMLRYLTSHTQTCFGRSVTLVSLEVSRWKLGTLDSTCGSHLCSALKMTSKQEIGMGFLDLAKTFVVMNSQLILLFLIYYHVKVQFVHGRWQIDLPFLGNSQAFWGSLSNNSFDWISQHSTKCYKMSKFVHQCHVILRIAKHSTIKWVNQYLGC